MKSIYTEVDGVKVITFERFCKQNTNRGGRKEWRFIEAYGDVSFEDAYGVYVDDIVLMDKVYKKIESFEKHLVSLGVKCVESNISESRYYNLNGVKYRFSSHVYPTGTMTSENCIDFCANPKMILDIEF